MAELPAVLVVDDEVRSQETLRRTLEDEFEVFAASGAAEAEAILEREWVQAILCDQRMPGVTGVEFLKQVRRRWPDVVRMIVSGFTDSEDIIEGINEGGIYQYITKPWNPDSLLLTVRAAVQLYRLQRENHQLGLELKIAVPPLQDEVARKRQRLKRHFDFGRVTRAPDSPLNAVCELVGKVAQYNISVLITGESGTGKELMARAIHYNSGRAGNTFVVENCGALPDQLLESELFGYKKGAFTGAYEDRIGLFEQADSGTIFFDEIGEVSPAFQVKLLRVLQEGEIRPLGSTRTRKIDVRVVAATNRNLEDEVRAGRFRQDLYYRLAPVTVHVPALRERAMDVPLLAERFVQETSRGFGKTVCGFTAEALECMAAYHWPGNVRELRNEVQRMTALAEDQRLGAELLSPRVLRAESPEQEFSATPGPGLDGTLKDRVEALEGSILKETLIRNRWNKSKAAEELGLSRVGLRSKLQRYGLEPKH